MAYLRYIDDSGQLQTRTLDSEQFVIGRADSCQLSFDSEMISREHLRIDLQPDGRHRIRDLDSRNKTFVNGELIRETLLTSGAVIRVGDRVLEFLEDSAEPESISLEFLTPDRKEPPDCEWIKMKVPLSLTEGQLEQLAHLVGDQALTARAEDVADAALGRILLDLQAERGLIALRGERKTDLQILAHRALKRPPGGSMTPVSQSFLYAPLLQRVAGRYPQTTGQLNTTLGYASCGVVAPLMFRGAAIGVLYVDRPLAKKPFPAADLQYVAASAAHIGARLGDATHKLTQFAGREGITWMSSIRRLQSTLADPIPSSEAFKVAVKCHPGRLRCGDFATVLHLDEQRCGMVVVDGGGHGISGLVQSKAILLAVQSALSVSEDALMDPSILFNAINRVLVSSTVRQVLPCTFVGVDMSSGKLAYINAGGMPPLLMVAPGRLVTLDQLSLVMGVDADCLYDATRVDLPEVFRIICYTDGLTEATSPAGDAFGDQRLHDTLLEREAFAGASDVVTTIGRSWSTHMAGAQAEDDALVLVVAHG